MQELIIDLFAGGGGASTGIEWALGRSPDIAVNHDPIALAMHAMNHPDTVHLPHNVWKVAPHDVCKGSPVGLLWMSPDCKHFSKAKGGKPVEKHIRDLAWVGVRWAREVKPRIIILENVEEFATWGPLAEDGRPCPKRKGKDFKRFCREFRREGYKLAWRERRACNAGAPTVRKRLYWIARRDGLPIIFPEPTHGDPESLAVTSGKLQPWRVAADIIDWSIPCPSIFATSAEVMRDYGVRAIRPLADATMARIAKGVQRYVIDAAKPFIAPITHTRDRERGQSVNDPLATVTAAHRGEQALVAPFVARVDQTSGDATRKGVHSIEEPTRTIASAGGLAVAAPFITKFNKGVTGHRADDPLHTITACHSETHPAGGSTFGIVTPFLAPRYQEKDGQEPRTRSVEEPAATITGRGNAPGMLVTPFMVPRYGERPGQEPRTHSLEDPTPVVVPTANGGTLIAPLIVKNNFGDKPHYPADEPVRTIVAGGTHHALVAPVLSRQFGASVGSPADEPAPTVMPNGGGKTAVVAAFLAQQNTDVVGHSAEEPVSTIVQKGCTQAVVSAGLVSMKGSERRGGSVEQPAPTVTAQGWHIAETRAFLLKYHANGGQHAACDEPAPTVDTHGRIGLVMVEGEPYQIVDIGMRMLTPRELFRAQGFRDDYVINRGVIVDYEHYLMFERLDLLDRLVVGADGTFAITKTDQIRMCGNSVSPYEAAALVGANYEPVEVTERGVPGFALQAAE